MTNVTLTKTQAVVLAIWGCVAISAGSNHGGFLTDILLVFGGAMVGAALIIPANRDHGDE